MAYFRIRGNCITLLHGVRVPGRGVRQRRIWTFSGVDELRRHLEPDAWARLQIEVEQRHPHLAIDWQKVRQQGNDLLEGAEAPAPSLQERLDEMRRTLRRLLRRLPDGSRPEDRDFALALGPLLRPVILRAFSLYNSYPEPRSYSRELLEHILPDSDPEMVDDLVSQGRYFLARGRKKGVQLFKQARHVAPYDPDVVNSEGIGWMEQGNLDQAERCFQIAREMALPQLPDQERAWSWCNLEVRPYIRATNNLALMREQQGRHREALDLYEECLARCPDDGIGARFRLGPLHQRLGHFHRALDFHLESATGSLVDPPDPLFDMASALLQLNRPREAVQRLIEGLAINHQIPPLLLKPPKRWSSDPRHASVDSRDWALSYVRDHGDLWPPHALAFLAEIWRDRELRHQFRILKNLEAEREEASLEERRDVVQRLRIFQDSMFPEDTVERLQDRLAAWWEASRPRQAV